VAAEVRNENKLEDSKAAFLAVLDQTAGGKPITEEEVDRAKARILKNIALSLNSADRVGLQMSEYIGAGDWRLFFLERDLVRGLKVDDVRRVAALYLKPSNRTLGEFIPTAKPDRTEVPAAPDLEKLLAGYTGDKAKDQGEVFDPSPANVEARTKRGAAGSVKLALLPKKTRGGSVVASLWLHFGDETSLRGQNTAADLAIDMLMRGSKKHTRQQITDELDKLQARMAISGSVDALRANVETTRDNLPAALKLLGEVLREPAFSEKEFELLRQENLAQLEKSRSEPQEKASRALSRHTAKWPKGDPREVQTLDELVANYKAAKLADVAKFHAEFLGAQAAELAVVGDFDEAAIAKLANDTFGSWKAKKPFARLAKPFQDAAPVSESIEAPDKANAFFIAAQPVQMKDNDPDWPAMALGNYMLGGGFLNSRLAVRIRQKEGLSYGVGAGFLAPALDDSARFTGFAIYAPQNVEKLEKAFREEVARALESGFTDTEVAEAKTGWLQGRNVSRAQDGALANALLGTLYVGRTLAWDEQKEKEVAALTPAQIQAAMKRHLDPAKLVIFKSGDFAGAKAKAAAAPAAAPAAPAPATK
jgi:zinc protease